MTDGPIGLLGLGARATDFYRQELQRAGIKVQLVETDFEGSINPHLPDPQEILDERLAMELDKFRQVGAILIPNITLHETLDRIDPNGSRYPVIHAIRETLGRLQQMQIGSVTLFGSGYSMNSPCLREQFEHAGIHLVQPSADEETLIDLMRQRVYLGREDPVNLESYRRLLNKHREQNTVVIACTELSLISEPEHGILDMARVQLDRAVQISG